MNATTKPALWARVNMLLAEHERAQTAAIRLAVAKAWEDLRTKLQVLALEDEPANDES